MQLRPSDATSESTAQGPLRIGLVGCGMIGQIHADGLRKLAKDGEVVAIGAADPSSSALEAAAANCPFEFMTQDPAEVMADPTIEAVLITSPTATHRDLVVAAIEAGKALLCEKPLAPTYGEVEELCMAVERSGLVAQVGFHSRFHPLVNRLRDLVLSGEFGRPMGYTLRDDQYWPTGDVVPGHSSWRSQRHHAGGGALLEHSIHAADIVNWLFGPARAVHAFGRSMFGYDVEDVATLTIEHESGVVGTLLSVFNGVRGREERRFEVFFEHGSVELTTDFIVGAPEDSFLVQRPDEAPERPDLDEMREIHFTRLGLHRRDFLFYTYPSDRNWVHCVKEQVMPSPGFADALDAHRLVEAAYKSMQSRATVEISAI
ncbi:MAG TPA: Gfo/Idh/MocA family oxidoreductase [Acidimicrobiales bacterium]|nr:Gfo/Idh/MocA family oxidoreductase [Acidimicrobiales bacterium]